jgi:hypothetical protein
VRFAVTALALVAVTVGSQGLASGASRVAVVIGNDVGRPGEPSLRYAERDARRIADILQAIGGFAPADTTVLLGRSESEVRRALEQAEARLAGSGAGGLMLVYYSGHADASELHLGGGTLALNDLQRLLAGATSATHLMIVDACRSGTLTQTKGGRPGPNFDMQVIAPPNPRGFAIITSSAAGEEAQESDDLRASFFTHHLASALLGAADRDGDGTVTLAEAFAYAARRTIASTATTWLGPQHPTFKLELGGREDLVLTRPGLAGSHAQLGQLALGEPGWYLIRREHEPGLVAEVSGDDAARPLTLVSGRYEVIRRGDRHLLTGMFEVKPAEKVAVSSAHMRRVDFGRVVRKGGTERTRAIGLFAGGGVRGSLLGLGAAMAGGLGARLDLRRLSLTAAFDFAAGATESARGSRLETQELSFRLGAFRPFDLSALTLAPGIEVGLSRIVQTASDEPMSQPSGAMVIGPAAIGELPITRRWFLWLQAAAPLYWMSAQLEDRMSDSRVLRITYRLGVAVGGYL